MTEQVALCIGLAYLLGSFPSAYVVGRLLADVDIRQVGDGNVGARNTFLTVGRRAGIAVAALDIAKGSIAVLVARRAGLQDWSVLIAGGAAVLGHDFMLFLGFRGGQGMATTIGVLLVIFPLQTCVGLCLAGLAWLLLRGHFNVSMAIGLGSTALLAWATGKTPRRVWYPLALLPTIGIRKLMQICAAHRTSGAEIAGPETESTMR